MSRDPIGSSTRFAGLARGVLAAAALVGALAAHGCSRKGGSVPLSFTPEGASGQDNAMTVELKQEPDTVVRDTSGAPLDTLPGQPYVQVRIYDHTPASGYRLYRRLDDTGYEPAVDYVTPFRGTLNSGFETYDAVDRDWQPERAQTYLARGVVAGQVSSLSPLTNPASIPAGELDALRVQDFLLRCPIDTVRTDSLPLLVWTPVPGATRYLVQIIRSADARPFFIGFTPATGVTHYQIGSGDGTVIHEALMTRALYRWSVDAIDDNWRVIGRSDSQLFTVTFAGLPTVVHCSP